MGTTERRRTLTAGMLARIRRVEAERGVRQQPTEEQRRRDEKLVEKARRARR